MMAGHGVARDTPPAFGRQVGLIGRVVLLELLRRRDLYVALLLVGLFAAGALVSRLAGIDKPSVGTFLLNLGLSLAYYAAHLLTLILSAKQLPAELEQRTLYPLLAKPVLRSTVLVGKWLACAVAGVATYLLLSGVVFATAPILEHCDSVLLAQALLLAACSLILLSALSVCFSLLWTRGTVMVVMALWMVGGGKCVAFVTSVVPDTLRDFVAWLVAYVPDFSRLDLITRYTDGLGPVSSGTVLGLLLYALTYTAVGLLIANGLFARRSL